MAHIIRKPDCATTKILTFEKSIRKKRGRPSNTLSKNVCQHNNLGIKQFDRSLWQWTKIPFGLCNAVSGFQRIIDDIIKSHECKGTFTYLDNITVGGKTQQEHDDNLAKFLEASHLCNITFNDSKCVYSTECVKLLSYEISEGSLKPDPDRVKTLLELPPTTTINRFVCLLGSVVCSIFQ